MEPNKVVKTVTCSDMGGPSTCTEKFTGTVTETVEMGAKHLMSTTDEDHKPMRDQMTNGKEEDKAGWMQWWNGVFDSK